MDGYKYNRFTEKWEKANAYIYRNGKFVTRDELPADDPFFEEERRKDEDRRREREDRVRREKREMEERRRNYIR